MGTVIFVEDSLSEAERVYAASRLTELGFGIVRKKSVWPKKLDLAREPGTFLHNIEFVTGSAFGRPGTSMGDTNEVISWSGWRDQHDVHYFREQYKPLTNEAKLDYLKEHYGITHFANKIKNVSWSRFGVEECNFSLYCAVLGSFAWKMRLEDAQADFGAKTGAEYFSAGRSGGYLYIDLDREELLEEIEGMEDGLEYYTEKLNECFDKVWAFDQTCDVLATEMSHYLSEYKLEEREVEVPATVRKATFLTPKCEDDRDLEEEVCNA